MSLTLTTEAQHLRQLLRSVRQQLPGFSALLAMAEEDFTGDPAREQVIRTAQVTYQALRDLTEDL